MKRILLLLVGGLFASSAALAQTAPATNAPSTTRSTNTVGLGGTVNGTPTSTDAGNGTPARYDDRNSGLPSQSQVRMKSDKPKKAQSGSKTKTSM